MTAKSAPLLKLDLNILYIRHLQINVYLIGLTKNTKCNLLIFNGDKH